MDEINNLIGMDIKISANASCKYLSAKMHTITARFFYPVTFCLDPQRFSIAIFFLLLCVTALAQVSTPSQAILDKKHVLVIHSYHKGYLWTDEISEGIAQALTSASIPVSIQHEYMDSKRIYDEIYMQQVINLYKYKFQNKHFDVIVSSDDNAFNFLRDYRDQLFPETPIIYCGTNYITLDRAEELPNSTGVNEAASLQENFDLILKLHPEATQLAIIIDSSTTGNRVKQQLSGLLPGFRDRIKIVMLQDLTINDLVDKIKQLPSTAVVLYTVFFRDSAGNFYEYDDSINMITEASAVPVYVTWDFSMGNGAVGGILTSGKAQGETAGILALQVLMGKPIDTIPLVKESPNQYVFDYNSLHRFEIGLNKLPKNSIIYNLPEVYSKKYRQLILRTTIAGIVLFLIIGLLIINILRRKRAEIMLSQMNEELEERVRLRTQDLSLSNNKLNEEILEKKLAEEALRKSKRLLKITGAIANVGGWELNVAQNKLTWTEEIYKINEVDLSFTPDIEKTFNFFYPESKQHIREAVQRAIEYGEPFDLELRFITYKGNHRWARTKGEAVQIDGTTLKVFGTFQDITDRKHTEELLVKHKERLHVLNGIIRHDISNDLIVIKSATQIFMKNGSDKMLEEILCRANKSIKTIAEFKSHKEFIDSNTDLVEIDLYKMISRVIEEFPLVKNTMNNKCFVYADDALYYVFSNIISNSIKHGDATQVDIAVTSLRDNCIIMISDNGNGIQDKIKNQIFDEGFCFGETGNTGMGLYLVKQSIEHYNGIISVEDNQPKGVVFKIYLRKAFSLS